MGWPIAKLRPRVLELRERGLAPVTTGDILSIKAENPEGEEAIRQWRETEQPILDEYLAGYCKGLIEGDADEEVEQLGYCPGCLSQLGGDFIATAIGLSTFQWGIAHGEGNCRECGWPVTTYHSVFFGEGNRKGRMPEGGSKTDCDLRFEALLPAHPDAVAGKGIPTVERV